MTAQPPDLLIPRGGPHCLQARPLWPRLRRIPKHRHPLRRYSSTADRFGPDAVRGIRDGRLRLLALQGHRVPVPHGEGIVAPDAEPMRRLFPQRAVSVLGGALGAGLPVFNPPSPPVHRIDPDGGRHRRDGVFRAGQGGDRPDPFPPDAPVEPWRLRADPDWDTDALFGDCAPRTVRILDHDEREAARERKPPAPR